MSHNLQLAIRYLESLEWRFMVEEEQEIIRLDISVPNAKLDCILHVLPKQEFILFFSLFPIPIPEEKRLLIAEYITRANYGLNAGNLELDFKDGEVRYRTYCNTDNDSLNEEIIRHLIHVNIQTMDRYAAGIMKVLYGNQTPLQAIEEVEIENDDEDDDDEDTNQLLKDLLN
ncbi:MAG: YbjN domain-containing protein [Chitinophagales bacterium]|nr:YbjN domain-containing protein [Chitinophagales bacterium]